jgi:hypothetical protein
VRRVGDPQGNKHSSGWSPGAQVLISHGRKYVRHLSSEPVRLAGRAAPCQSARVATDVRRIYAGPAVLGAEMHRRVLRRPSRMCSQTRSRCGRRRSRISSRSMATRSSELVLSSRRTAACAPSSPWCTRPRCSTPSRYPVPLPTPFRALPCRATACPCNPRAPCSATLSPHRPFSRAGHPLPRPHHPRVPSPAPKGTGAPCHPPTSPPRSPRPCPALPPLHAPPPAPRAQPRRTARIAHAAALRPAARAGRAGASARGTPLASPHGRGPHGRSGPSPSPRTPRELAPPAPRMPRQPLRPVRLTSKNAGGPAPAARACLRQRVSTAPTPLMSTRALVADVSGGVQVQGLIKDMNARAPLPAWIEQTCAPAPPCPLMRRAVQ